VLAFPQFHRLSGAPALRDGHGRSIVVREELAVSFTQFHQVIFGVVFILIVLLLPGGLTDIGARVKRGLAR